MQRNRKGWSPEQRKQSEEFWQKKNARLQRQAEARYIRENRERRRQELAPIIDQHIVSGPAGNVRPMPIPAQRPVAPQAGATMRYGGMMDSITEFLDPAQQVRSVHNAGGAQFIQNFNNNAGINVTRRVGVDVEPSAHVQQHGPHLNLQTQHNGVIQGGALADPHTPVFDADPFPAGHRLHGMQPEERRQFMERHLHSSGVDIRR